jgi:hypothetical protein
MRSLFLFLYRCRCSAIATRPGSAQMIAIGMVAVFVLLSGSSLPSWCQANVNEASETASIYVDAVNGNDSNSGTKTAPLKTIGAGVKLAEANNNSSIGSKVIINPGTYREAVVIDNTRKSTNVPMTFQAATNGTAIVSGANLITGWTAYKGSSTIYEASWPYNFSVCPAEAGAPVQQQIMLHQEMIIVNGTPLTQVLTQASMVPGTFYVDTTHLLAYIYPPAGTNISTATVEAAARPSLWQISGQSYVVVRGLTFQYANTCPGTGAAVSVAGSSTNILFDTDSFLWNNARALFFTTAENFTVQNSVANSNGQVGFASFQVKNSLWQNDTANYNNWRGAQSAFYTWDRGGGKWMLDHSGTYKNIVSNFNQATGAFWDTDNENVSYSSGVSVMNLVNAMQIEKAEGPFAVSNSYFCYGNLLGIGQRGGIAVRNSEQITLTGTTIYGSLVGQLVIMGNAGGIEITNWETGQTINLITSKFTSTSNTWTGPSAAAFSDSYLGGSDWNDFVSTLNSNSNKFWSGVNSNGFVIPLPKDGTKVALSSWQTTTGQDKSSSWTSTAAPSSCNVTASTKDFWVTSSSFKGVTVSSGGQVAINVGTFGLGGISGNVALTMSGVTSVAGLKGSFGATSIPATGSTVLNLTAGASTPAGTYPITILGTVGSLTHTVTIPLVVQ